MRSTLGWFHHHMWMISSVIPCLPKSKWNNITCVECSRLALELLDVPGFGRLVHFLSIPGLQHSFTSELKKKAARKSRGRRRRIHHYFSHQRNSQRAVAPHLPFEQIPSASTWLPAELILLKGQKEKERNQSAKGLKQAHMRCFWFAIALGKTSKGPSLLAKRILVSCGQKAELLHALEFMQKGISLPLILESPEPRTPTHFLVFYFMIKHQCWG